jgi:hypothetical protein
MAFFALSAVIFQPPKPQRGAKRFFEMASTHDQTPGVARGVHESVPWKLANSEKSGVLQIKAGVGHAPA